jgi:DNA-binding transcriptional regulator YiaG
VTQAEIRALLARCDPRKLRQDAGISKLTVMRALGASRYDLSHWETGRSLPSGPAGRRWARFIRGLERHAEVTAELAAMDEAA